MREQKPSASTINANDLDILWENNRKDEVYGRGKRGLGRLYSVPHNCYQEKLEN